MLNADWLYDQICSCGIDFVTGVPDSVLRPFCDVLASRQNGARHVVAANEGGAIALAAGHHLATGKIGLVYLQNSGLGNAVNPLLSLADREVYAIPMLLLIGWRGRPGGHDEPQHLKQGRVTGKLLDAMEIPWGDLGDDEATASQTLKEILPKLQNNPGPCVLLVGGKALAPYAGKAPSSRPEASSFVREEAIKTVIGALPSDTVYLGTTGMISRELFELRQKAGDGAMNYLMNVGAMGHVTQIALAIATDRPDRNVVCLDGDGSLLMHLGVLATNVELAPKNMLHVVLNNQAHDSVGGQATANLNTNLAAFAKTAGYASAVRVENAESLHAAITAWRQNRGLTMIEVMVRRGARKDLGRPGDDLADFKRRFMGFLNGS